MIQFSEPKFNNRHLEMGSCVLSNVRSLIRGGGKFDRNKIKLFMTIIFPTVLLILVVLFSFLYSLQSWVYNMATVALECPDPLSTTSCSYAQDHFLILQIITCSQPETVINCSLSGCNSPTTIKLSGIVHENSQWSRAGVLIDQNYPMCICIRRVFASQFLLVLLAVCQSFARNS